MELLAGYADRVLEYDDGSLATVFEDEVQCLDAGPDGVYCGTSDGLYRRRDGEGTEWERVADVGDVTAVAVHESGVWVGTEPSAVYHAPEGERFTECSGLTDVPSSDDWAFPPRPSTHHVRWLEPTAERLYAAIEAGALVRSPDGGETCGTASARALRHALHDDHADRPALAYSAAGDGFYVTRDGGDSWTTAASGLDRSYCWSVVCDPDDPSECSCLPRPARGAPTDA
ncbi:WD40/YVTN/BNR-like repeat-containing protein, partial [Halobacterium bonnevillei]|nr:hypothetical protein [Halobacterium bonnevillei]